jgi:hypothetical protein
MGLMATLKVSFVFARRSVTVICSMGSGLYRCIVWWRPVTGFCAIGSLVL